MSCDYRDKNGDNTCSAQIGGDCIGETTTELRRRARAAGWAKGTPDWHRLTHGPGRRVDLCPGCAHKADVTPQASKR